MANKIVSRDNFIATIGYDRAVQAYNTATGGHYTVKKLAKLFGLAEPSCKKVLML